MISAALAANLQVVFEKEIVINVAMPIDLSPNDKSWEGGVAISVHQYSFYSSLNILDRKRQGRNAFSYFGKYMHHNTKTTARFPRWLNDAYSTMYGTIGRIF